MQFSDLGRKLTARTGILELMDDLGKALTTQPDMRMLGGGNPAPVPAIQQIWRERLTEMLTDGDVVDRMLGNYDPPQGNPRFLKAIAGLLERTYGWPVTAENIAITTGGQSAFFYLFNLLAGPVAGRNRKVLLPLCPEYIGYADQGIAPDLFTACLPRITWPQGENAPVFKYQIDMEAVKNALATQDIACVAVSRPTNPSGNVLTDAEISQLSALTKEYGIPLIVDNAYGAPFPNIIFEPVTPYWDSHAILTMSLSKLGLPGTRTAIVVAPPSIATAIASMTAIAGLANGNLGQQMVLPMIENNDILRLGPEILKPFYQEKSKAALALADKIFKANNLRYAIHASEGAFFHWLWLPDLDLPAQTLYQRLKARKTLIVPGEYFFFGLPNEAIHWPHRRQCIRMNYAQPLHVLEEAFQIIAEEAKGCEK